MFEHKNAAPAEVKELHMVLTLIKGKDSTT